MKKYEAFEKLTDVLGVYTSANGTIWLNESSATFDDMADKYGLAVSEELIRYESEFDRLAMRLLAMGDIIETLRNN